MDTDQARAELATRPPISEAVSSLYAVQQAMADAVASVVGGLTWGPSYEQRAGSCDGPLTGLGGKSATLSGLAVARSVNDTWGPVLAAARSVADRNGFTEIVIRVDDADHHDVRFIAADGAYLDFGSQVETVIRGTTGCHPQG